MIDFNSLNLDLSEVKEGNARLRSGRYKAKITKMELKAAKTGSGTYAHLTFDAGADGMINVPVCVAVAGQDEKAKTTLRIGLETIKKLLTISGHNNPDRPGNLHTALMGKVVGIICEPDYYSKDGKVMESSKVSGFFVAEDGMQYGPDGRVHSAVAKTSGSGRPVAAAGADLNDDIPF